MVDFEMQGKHLFSIGLAEAKDPASVNTILSQLLRKVLVSIS